MNQTFVSTRSISDLILWDRMRENQRVFGFKLELTARCNNNCSHCYINLPADDRRAQGKELSFEEIMDISDQAIKMGALWCTITGGEPLLRKDFKDIYIGLKKKGLIISIFTNATLIKEDHIELFKKYPPRDIEVTVYGITRETYEAVSHCSGSYQAFMRGLNLLMQNGLKVRLKTVALRSNFEELTKIAQFCRERTMDYFRYDPLLILRLDQDAYRNKEIKSERLTPSEVVKLEISDSERMSSLEKSCDKLINPEFSHIISDKLFQCGIGNGSFVIGSDGNFRLCMSFYHPDCIFDLRKYTLSDIWQNLVPKIKNMRSVKEEFLNACRKCPIINLCAWCPAHAYLETGEMDTWVEYFCQVAHERAKALGYESREFLQLEEKKNPTAQ